MASRRIALSRALFGQQLATRNASYDAPVTGGSSMTVMGDGTVKQHPFANQGYPPGLEPGHYDEHIVPKGSWEESHQRYQRKYNIQLALGALLFFGTLGWIIQTEAIDLVLAPPMKNKK